MSESTHPAEALDESFGRAIAEGRAHNVQRLNLFRFAGVTLAFAVTLLLPPFVPEARERQPDLFPFAAYVAVAAAVYGASRRSAQIAKLSGLAILVVDMPAVFLLNWHVVARIPGDPRPALFMMSAYVLLIIVSAFTLDDRQLLLSVLAAIVLESALQHRSGLDPGFIVGSTLLLGGAGILCSYPSRRAIHLVRSVAAEQLFLSPGVRRPRPPPGSRPR